MSGIFKKAAKGAGQITANTIKTVLGGLLSEVVSDIIKETGLAEEMKGKLVELGVSAIQSSGMDIKSIKKDFLMNLVKGEAEKLMKK